jgi:hypothetical protein
MMGPAAKPAKHLILAAALAFVGAGDRALAQDDGSAAAFMQGAVGLSVGVVQRRDYGEGNASRLLLEPVFHSYVPLGDDRMFGRVSVHGGYIWQQPEMPRAVRIEEKDIYGGFALGLVWDGVVVPSLTGGAQVVNRTISFKASDPVDVQKDPISRSETLFGWFAQVGLGVPLLQGRLVFEPFYRHRWFADDPRESWGYGVETTYQLF